MSNCYPTIFYMDWRQVENLNNEYLNAGYELGWYYQTDLKDLPVGPFITENEAEEELQEFFSRFNCI